ncbi:chromosome transmission fidelity protein 18 homolog isoform X2 [Engraulis encrasicolus]|uniref:chromosome transmission fidelity protein 18 homolog isoform X2 n=1 Tax=Engraulis encrasicolus TaxID=184585 RepID=UPI002FD16273
MDEYDEMYGIEDDFEQQFADELEIMAEMEKAEQQGKVSKYREEAAKSRQSSSEVELQPRQSFEEAIAAGDTTLPRRAVAKQPLPSAAAAADDDDDDYEDHLIIALTEEEEKEAQTPVPKRRKFDVAKKLTFNSAPSDDITPFSDDITPPSSPEAYERSRPRPVSTVTNLMDMSGLGALQDTPSRVAMPTSSILRRAPLTGDYITVTNSNGDRVYLRQKEEQSLESVVRSVRGSHNSLGLLATPIEVLMEQAMEKRHRQVVEESQRLTDLISSNVNEALLGVGVDVDDDDGGDEDQDGSSSRLWVDRFSPRHYTDLLSDDFTNRCLLKWLKLWDCVVFGRERKPRPIVQENQLQGGFQGSYQSQGGFKGNNQSQGGFKGNNQSQGGFKTKSQITEEILEAELDQYKRPKYKVALLSGPPGLGKTTLAHIIAKHAGYNVVEINASDDRSAELFQKRIDTATQMKSVLGANEKPNCLIIDEIDGAPSAAINVLLAILNRKESRDEGEGAGPNSLKKKKKKENVLLRPIICICNDLYVPALRPLRQQAFLLAFPQTQPSRLTQRLAEISRYQGMKVDTGTLMALCEKTDNDIRSCINTLQFLHGRGKRQLDVRAVSSVCVGQKDQNKGLFSIWQEIFQLPRNANKRKRIGREGQEGVLNEGAQRLHHILHLASSCGENEKITQGLYDNFLHMKLKDPSLGGVCAGLDWLCFVDVLGEYMMHTQNFTLLRYTPFLPAAFHMLYAHTHTPRINYPSSHYEALTKQQQLRNGVVAMLADIPPSVRSRVAITSLCLDMLSLLLDLIAPKLRPVNPQLYSSREKQQLLDLIDTMINYNLNYTQQRNPEGQYTYLLEPNVEEVVRFPGLPPRRQLTYQVKQLIAREIELERMRRTERAQLRRNANTRGDPQEVMSQPQAAKVEKQEVKRVTSKNHQQRLENIVKQAVVETRPEMDFFGRVIVPKDKPASTNTAEEGKGGVATKGSLAQIGVAVGNSDVWFRFNEGVSNAVRRNVYIRELL